MQLNTNLPNRVKNTQLSYSKGLMPLFEAVQNSIHAIEQSDMQVNEGEIVVEIVRENQPSLELRSSGASETEGENLTMDESESARPGPPPLPEITGFRIKDRKLP